MNTMLPEQLLVEFNRVVAASGVRRDELVSALLRSFVERAGSRRGTLGAVVPLTPADLQTRVRPFISYAREDVDIARRLCRKLRKLGVQPWLDLEQLVGGQRWELVIRQAISECTHFVALISRHSVSKRGFVQKELRRALEVLSEFPPDQTFVIPVRLDGSLPTHEELTHIHWIDLFPNFESGVREIARSLGIVV